MEKCTIADVLMNIHDRQCLFLKTDTMEIVNPMDFLEKYLPENPTEEDYEKLPTKASLHIYALPGYEFINHEFIMRFYVKNMIDDKEIRKELFYILRNHDYLDKFYVSLKKHNLFEEYREYSSDYYHSVFRQWCEKNNIKLN